MTGTAQRSVNDLAAAVEPHAARAWPARETAGLDGWLLRFTDGFSSRANSVLAQDFTGRSLPDAIAAVEAAYRARGLPAQFQISPAARPADLERVLIARGYAHKTPTQVMIADAAALAAPGGVDIASHATQSFVRLTREGSHSPRDGDERLATLARAPDRKAFFVFRDAACGASVATGDWASVFVMRTTPAERRKGHGGRILSAIAAWAVAQGAARLYLQVDETNVAGRALYARAGFRDGYRYLHYVAPAGV